MNAILINGVEYPMRTPVRRFDKRELPRVPEFHPGDGYNKRRRVKIDTGMIHWTGAENPLDVVAETLRKKKYGIEFGVQRAREIWQFCDPALVDTADAGFFNARSFGVEVVCFGFAAGWLWDPVRALRVPRVPKLGRDRETYLTRLHGKQFRAARFYPGQMDALLELIDVAGDALQIPRVVEVTDTVLPAAVNGTWSGGWLGHYQITTSKRDPGPWPLERVRDHFAQPRLLEVA